MNDGTINKTLGYGAGNQETSVSGGGTALSYDFKGNVTTRPPLDGTDAYGYTWDAYDRLRSAARTGQTTVNYTYDAMGRLLKRTQGSETTINYWLGLNRIAVEQWGPGAGNSDVVFRPDSEEGNDPEANGTNGWDSQTASSTATYEQDEYASNTPRGKVLKLYHTSSAYFVNGDLGYGDYNPHDAAYALAGRYQLGVWLRNAYTGHPYSFEVHLYTSVGYKELTFNTGTGTDFKSDTGDYRLHDYIGSEDSWNDGAWHYMEFDLLQRLQNFYPGATIIYVNGIGFYAKELYLDDLIFSEGKLKRTYQQTGNALGGTLAEQLSFNESSEKAYYQYNELGTVVATTTDDSVKSGIWVPDYYGTYRHISYGPSHPEIGLTGKQWDSDLALYYFNARWYDPERSRFLSKANQPLDVENPYTFANSSPIKYFDPTGNIPQCVKDAIDTAKQILFYQWEDVGKQGHHQYHCLVSCLSNISCSSNNQGNKISKAIKGVLVSPLTFLGGVYHECKPQDVKREIKNHGIIKWILDTPGDIIADAGGAFSGCGSVECCTFVCKSAQFIPGPDNSFDY